MQSGLKVLSSGFWMTKEIYLESSHCPLLGVFVGPSLGEGGRA